MTLFLKAVSVSNTMVIGEARPIRARESCRLCPALGASEAEARLEFENTLVSAIWQILQFQHPSEPRRILFQPYAHFTSIVEVLPLPAEVCELLDRQLTFLAYDRFDHVLPKPSMMSGSRVDMKVVLLGKEYGGKTCLVERYLHDRFIGEVPYQSTIGAAFGAKRIEVGDRVITLGIWDTAGSERYESMSRIYYRGARAAILCYDLTDRTSFERVEFWVKELKTHEENCKIYLVGTKVDIVKDDRNFRQVDYHMTTDYADTINAEVFETSSKTGENIKELFCKIGLDYINSADANKPLPGNDESFELRDSPKKLNCCGGVAS